MVFTSVGSRPNGKPWRGSRATRRSAGPSVPVLPWHAAHLRSYSTAPCTGLPLPGGRPVPSAITSMSQALISSAVAGLPKPNVAGAPGGPASVSLRPQPPPRSPSTTTTNAPRTLTIGLERHGAVPPHPPRSDVIEMVVGAQAACLPELLQGRLHVAGLVHCAARECGFRPVPVPQVPEPRMTLGEYGLLQLGGRPAPPAIGAHVHARDPTAAAPRYAGDLPPAFLGKGDRVCGEGDDGFRVHDEAEHARGAVDELRGEVRPGLPVARGAVSGALDEVQPRDRGKALEGLEVEHHRALDHPVDQELVTVGVDGRHARVVALEVQVCRSDDPAKILQRRERDALSAPARDTARPLEP